MDGGSGRVRIPADIEMDDHLLGPLTARQLVILACTGIMCWFSYMAVGRLLPLQVAVAVAIVIIAAGVVLAIGRVDGVSLDRLAAAAIRQARAPHRLVPAQADAAAAPGIAAGAAATYADGTRGRPAGLLRLPARDVSPEGVIDLGPAGHAVLLACTTVPFGLRTFTEQQALTAGFGRWLNSLSSGVAQILVRAERIDMAPRIEALRAAAPGLPHPALEAAARAHAAFLHHLAASRDLLAHDVLVVLREPASPLRPTFRRGRSAAGNAGKARPQDGPAAAGQLLRRAEEASRALRAAGVTVRRLDGAEALAALAACADPDAPARTTDRGDRAAPGDVITASAEPTPRAAPRADTGNRLGHEAPNLISPT